MSTEKDRLEELDKSYRKLWEEHQQLKQEIQTNYAELRDIREKLGMPAPVAEPAANRPAQPLPQAAKTTPAERPGWEQYIGEQLLSKIGVVILIIGVGIGAKYAIDKQIIGPAMRILCGYIIAGLLGFFAWRFRTKYEGFSSVLVSGAMAVCYFITYAAYSFYGLIPHALTFVLLFLITGATVFFAIRYNRVIIAHIGLIGAYVLPAIIANKPSHISNYLLYMSVINLGILSISFLRNWKSLYYVAFWWTMLVFPVWFFGDYNEKLDRNIAFAYVTGYYVFFHVAALAFKLRTREPFSAEELGLIVPNILVYLAIGSYVFFAADSGYNTAFFFASAVGFSLIGIWQLLKNLRPEDRFLSTAHLVLGVLVLLIALSAFSYGSGAAAAVLRYADFFTIVGMLIILMRQKNEHAGFVTLLHLLMIWALSVEITSLLTAMGSRKAYALTLSLVWAVYGIYLLFTGISKKITVLRITAMIVLGITLGKVFFIDIVKLDLLAKTILFLVIGGILLVGAYLYQRYREDSDK